MTDKIYRLADKRDVGKLVYVSSKSLEDALINPQRKLTAYSPEYQESRYTWSWLNRTENGYCSLAFIEVTLADFNFDEIVEYAIVGLNKKLREKE